MAFVFQADRFGRKLIAFVLAVAILSLNFGVSVPKTAKGIQCPTAPIQKIVEVVREKNCCGKIVSKTIVRAPQEGEKGFKQCCCAEKKAANHEEEKQTTSVNKPTLVCALSDNPLNQAFEPLAQSWNETRYADTRQISPVAVPPTPPPQII